MRPVLGAEPCAEWVSESCLTPRWALHLRCAVCAWALDRQRQASKQWKSTPTSQTARADSRLYLVRKGRERCVGEG